MQADVAVCVLAGVVPPLAVADLQGLPGVIIAFHPVELVIAQHQVAVVVVELNELRLRGACDLFRSPFCHHPFEGIHIVAPVVVVFAACRKDGEQKHGAYDGQPFHLR